VLRQHAYIILCKATDVRSIRLPMVPKIQCLLVTATENGVLFWDLIKSKRGKQAMQEPSYLISPSNQPDHTHEVASRGRSTDERSLGIAPDGLPFWGNTVTSLRSPYLIS
jgi:hypothetical protein